MNLYLVTFIISACVIMIGGTYQLYSTNQGFGATVFFIGALTLFIIYGLRWFDKKPFFSPASGPWPPVMNTCPDYLTYYQRTVGGIEKDTCIDLIGASKDNSLLSPFPKDGTEPSSDRYYLDLSGLSSDPKDKSTQMCNRAITQKVTWEGVTNGESCISAAKPSGSGSGSGSESGTDCS
jgi:hypothetical protein